MSSKKEIADLCVIKLSRVNLAGDAWSFTVNVQWHNAHDGSIIVYILDGLGVLKHFKATFYSSSQVIIFGLECFQIDNP